MKINIECDGNILPGYINTSFNGLEGTMKCMPINLDSIAEDDSVDELIANNVLNKLKPQEVLHGLVHWSQKLKPGGKMHLTFIDIRSVAKAIAEYQIPLEKVDQFVFGANNGPRYQSVLDAETMKHALKQMGLKIDLISAKHHSCIIEASKS